MNAADLGLTAEDVGAWHEKGVGMGPSLVTQTFLYALPPFLGQAQQQLSGSQHCPSAVVPGLSTAGES